VESDSEKINIWDWRKRRVEKTIEKPRGGNTANTTNPLRYSSDGRFFAVCERSGEEDVVVRIWNTADWAIAQDIAAGSGTESRGGCQSIGFTPDGHLLLRTADTEGDPGNNLIAYPVDSWQPLWGLPMQAFFTPVSMAISPDGELAAIGGTQSILPAGAQDPNQSLDLIRHQPQIYLVSLRQRKIVKIIPCEVVGPIAWSPHGDRLALVGGPDVEILDSRSGQKLLHEKVEKSGHMNVRFTSDSRYFIESDMNGRGQRIGRQNLGRPTQQAVATHSWGHCQCRCVARWKVSRRRRYRSHHDLAI
jgi:WD40 repeat protein